MPRIDAEHRSAEPSYPAGGAQESAVAPYADGSSGIGRRLIYRLSGSCRYAVGCEIRGETPFHGKPDASVAQGVEQMADMVQIVGLMCVAGYGEESYRFKSWHISFRFVG